MGRGGGGGRGRRRALVGDAARAVDLEIDHHVAELADRLVAEGWDPAVARREAERRFGDVARYRDELLRATRWQRRRLTVRGWLESVLRDGRVTWRGLRRAPLFAITMVATLGLGLGVVAAVFTVLDALLLRPLPYRDADRLVEVGLKLEDGSRLPFLMADQIEPWEATADVLGPWALYEHESLVRTDGPQPEALQTLLVSDDLDEVIGLRAYRGRTFATDDATPGGARVMLSYSYWRRLGGDPGLVGSVLRLENRPYQVVGVLPPDFKFPVSGHPPALWVLMPRDLVVGGNHLSRVSVVARLADGISLEAAQSRMDALAAGLAEERPGGMGWRVALTPVTDWRGNPELVRGVWLLGGAVVLMLLIALVNGINLLLFRATDRAHELSVRLALGASRWRLLRQLLVESVLLGLLGGGVAVGLALAGVAGINRLVPEEFAFSAVYSFRVEHRVLAFTFLLSLATGVVLGLIPGIRAVAGGRLRFALLKGHGAGRRDGRLHSILMGMEVALAVMLLAGAALLATSFIRLLRVDPGFQPDRLVLMSINLPTTRYATAASREAFNRRLEAALKAAPDVQGVTIASGLPPHTGFRFGMTLQVESGDSTAPLVRYDPQGSSDLVLLPEVTAAPDYLRVIGGRVLSGRDLEATDVGTDNVLIDDQLARFLWGGGRAVGRRFRLDADGAWLTVVGVFRHQTMYGLDDRVAPWGIIRPRDPARPPAWTAVGIRVARSSPESLAAIRRVLLRLDPELPPDRLEYASGALVETVAKPRFLTTIMLCLSLAALVLAAVGVYSILSFAVNLRRRELGVRVALGARPAGVQGLFLRQGLRVAALGSVVGVAGAIALARLVRSLLFGVQPDDPRTLAAVVGCMLVVAAFAAWLPARRATHLDPVEVLRAE